MAAQKRDIQKEKETAKANQTNSARFDCFLFLTRILLLPLFAVCPEIGLLEMDSIDLTEFIEPTSLTTGSVNMIRVPHLSEYLTLPEYRNEARFPITCIYFF